MKFLSSILATLVIFNLCVISNAYALDLYVDTKTKQVFAEPGPGRIHMGTYVKADNPPVQPESPKVATTPSAAPDKSEKKETVAGSTPMREEKTAEVADKTIHERLASQVSVLEERVKDVEKIHGTFDDRGLHWATKDGNFSMSLNGRIQPASQYNFVNDPDPAFGSNTANELNSGMNIRRARLGAEGTFYRIWDYKFEFDFSRGNGSVGSGITDAFVRLNHTDALSYKIGSFKEPFSLEEAASNRFLTFIERHMSVNSFVDNPNTYKTGIGANYAVTRFQTGLAFQTEPIGAWSAASTSVNANGNQSRNNGSGDTGWQGIGRVSGRPWMEDETKFLHVGISAGHTAVNTQYRADGTMVGEGSNGGGGGMSFFAFPGTNVDRSNILNTGNLSTGALNDPNRREISSYDRYGAEAWFVHGPFSAQAEFLRTNINGIGYDGEHLTGYYGFVSYFLTGESKAYHVRNGAANRIRPNRPFQWNGSGWGAFELAAGYDYIDMNSGVIRGGRADMVRFGFNWYPHSNVKFQANVIHMLDINTARTPITNTDGFSGGAGARTNGWNNGDLSAFLTQWTIDF
ncbi:OprO/OprP family phosphate-selective porin [Nitrosomonas ureae]|uniref:Phosphate-selective porin OprO/OprP n=1 Tax=Nitrosomonas ureae TaxID=44577 RepID=A0A2T5I6N8_9PROT|nr:porin [Nitrosomonas ureae]PTQ79494.1 phosphate-selective porin OprO/OprP [Nitrosomonas ureae]PXX08685.1 phosphate-selective porin OprO/OprP [Nitrosomonas ureae]